MKVSYNWLKSYIPQIPDPKELEHIFTFHVCEVEEVIEKENDIVFDLKILPDRAGDLLSHIGIAREVSGLLGISYSDPTQYYKIPESKKTNLQIDVQTSNCRRYVGRIIRNFKVGPSPEWVVKYLQSIGERSINNIVDASNIVMFDCGQPTHAFDLKKLASEKIIIKESEDDIDFPVVGSENIVAKIKTGDLVICDEQKILALAGIKGGINSGISIDAPYTTDLLLEVANFDPVSVRKTGQRLSLLSDARKRFENNVSQELGDYAMREFSALLVEMCPEAIFEDVVDIYPTIQEKRQVSFTTNIISQKLGLHITPADIARILQNYKYSYIEENGNFIIHIPYWRNDITGVHDMVEEIGRAYGYDKIMGVLPVFPKNQDHDNTYIKIQTAKKYLLEQGYSEVMNYTFTKKGDVSVAHGVKGKEYLRTNLVDGMKESFEKNRLNAPLLGTTEIKMFEIGTVFFKDKEEIYVALATKKGIEEYTLDEFILKNKIDFSSQIPVLLQTNEASSASGPKADSQKFTMWSEYPFIFRDVSFWSEKEVSEEKFIEIMKPTLSDLCVKGPYLIDSFQKENRYSYAFRFVFQSYEKTLTDEDIAGEWNQILASIKQANLEIR